MAIDTAEKRSSVLQFAQSYGVDLPPATSVIDVYKRGFLCRMYAGIAAATPTTVKTRRWFTKRWRSVKSYFG